MDGRIHRRSSHPACFLETWSEKSHSDSHLYQPHRSNSYITAQSTGQFVVGRISVGIGSELASGPAPALIAEILLAKQQGTILGLCFTCYFVELLVSSGMNYRAVDIASTLACLRLYRLYRVCCHDCHFVYIWRIYRIPIHPCILPNRAI